MRIYCMTCKTYVLDTTDKFRCGGPYSGNMFKAPKGKEGHMNYFQFEEPVRDENIFCPYCANHLHDGAWGLLTEHGLLPSGQRTIDTAFSVIYEDGTLKSDSTFAKERSEIEDEGSKVEPESPVVAVEQENITDGEAEGAPEEEETDDTLEIAALIDEGVKRVSQRTWKNSVLNCSKCGKEIPYPAAHRKGCE